MTIRTILRQGAACWRVLWTGLTVLLLAVAPASRADGDTATRIAALHGDALARAWSRIYLRQSAAALARGHLASAGREEKLGPRWTPAAPEWQAAEAAMVGAMLAAAEAGTGEAEGLVWWRDTWAAQTRAVLSGREQQWILDTLTSPPGPYLAATMDWFVGELVMARLTFTDRARLDRPGAEADRELLQSVAAPLLEKTRHDFSADPRAELFIWTDPGRKYFREVSFRVVAAANARMDSAQARISPAFAAAAALAEPHIAAFRQR